MGGFRGGGKRGGKGSLPRYLLDHKVPLATMTRMMSKLILFNYLPGVEEFRQAMILFLLEYDAFINDHIRANYLDPEHPHKLGGRVAGLPGQVGSTNGGEKKGGG